MKSRFSLSYGVLFFSKNVESVDERLVCVCSCVHNKGSSTVWSRVQCVNVSLESKSTARIFESMGLSSRNYFWHQNLTFGLVLPKDGTLKSYETDSVWPPTSIRGVRSPVVDGVSVLVGGLSFPECYCCPWDFSSVSFCVPKPVLVPRSGPFELRLRGREVQGSRTRNSELCRQRWTFPTSPVQVRLQVVTSSFTTHLSTSPESLPDSPPLSESLHSTKRVLGYT